MPTQGEMLAETQRKLVEINRTPGCMTASAGCFTGLISLSCCGLCCFLARPDVITNPGNLPYLIALAVLGGIGGAALALRQRRVEKGVLEETESNLINSIINGTIFWALIKRESEGAARNAREN